MAHNLFHSLQTFDAGSGRTGGFYSLPQLEREGTSSLQSRGNQYYEWQRKMIKASETP